MVTNGIDTLGGIETYTCANCGEQRPPTQMLDDDVCCVCCYPDTFCACGAINRAAAGWHQVACVGCGRRLFPYNAINVQHAGH